MSIAAPPTRVRYFVLAALCAAVLLGYVHRGLLPVPAETIRNELQLTTSQMGWVLSSFYWVYALGQLPCGWLGDRFGARRMLPVFAVIWSTAAGALGLADSFTALMVCQSLNGLGQAGLMPCSAKTVSLWLPKKQRATAGGILASFMSIGGALASGLIGFLMRYWDWSTVFVSLATFGLLWAAAFYWWFRNRPEDHAAVNREELRQIREGAPPSLDKNDELSCKPDTADPDQVTAPWRALLTNSAMLWIYAQQFFRAGGYIFFATWFPTYLQKTRGVSLEQSGYLTALTLLGVVAGSLAGGVLSDWVYTRTGSLAASRKGLAIAGLTSCALLILLAFFIDDALTASAVIACASFSAGAAGPASYSMTMDLSGSYVSMAFSLMNMSGNIGAALSPKAVSWLVAASDQNWDSVLLLFVGIYAAAALCWLLLDPRKEVSR